MKARGKGKTTIVGAPGNPNSGGFKFFRPQGHKPCGTRLMDKLGQTLLVQKDLTVVDIKYVRTVGGVTTGLCTYRGTRIKVTPYQRGGKDTRIWVPLEDAV